MHPPALVSGSLFVSQHTLDQNDALATAVVLFGEFQHDTLSGAALNEADAQAEWVLIREEIRRRNPGAITPYINGLAHGGH